MKCKNNILKCAGGKGGKIALLAGKFPTLMWFRGIIRSLDFSKSCQKWFLSFELGSMSTEKACVFYGGSQNMGLG